MPTFKAPTPLILFVLCILTACGEPATPVEEAVQQFIELGVTAAEAGDAATLKTMVSRDYEDERGYKRIIIGRMLQTYLSQRKNIHLFYKIQQIDVIALDKAHVTMTIALANRAVDDVGLLAGLDADFQRLELDLVLDDEWQVIQAKWAPALAAEFE